MLVTTSEFEEVVTKLSHYGRLKLKTLQSHSARRGVRGSLIDEAARVRSKSIAVRGFDFPAGDVLQLNATG